VAIYGDHPAWPLVVGALLVIVKRGAQPQTPAKLTSVAMVPSCWQQDGQTGNCQPSMVAVPAWQLAHVQDRQSAFWVLAHV
jgi:hypothetical protein